MARVSKGKLKFLRRVYSMRMMLRELMLPDGGIDVFKLASRFSSVSGGPPRKFKCTEPTLRPCTYAEFMKHSVTINGILEGVLKRQSQSIVHKPRVMCTEIDHSSPDCSDRKLVLPFPEQGPIWHK